MSKKQSSHSSWIFRRNRRVAPIKSSNFSEAHLLRIDDLGEYSQNVEPFVHTPVTAVESVDAHNYCQGLEKPNSTDTEVQMPTKNLRLYRCDTFVQPRKSSLYSSRRSKKQETDSARSSATYVIDDEEISLEGARSNLEITPYDEAELTSVSEPNFLLSLSDLDAQQSDESLINTNTTFIERQTTLPVCSRLDKEGTILTIGDCFLRSEANEFAPDVRIDIPEQLGPDGEKRSTKKRFRIMKRFRGALRSGLTIFIAQKPPAGGTVSGNHGQDAHVGCIPLRKSVSERLRHSFTSNCAAISSLFKRKATSDRPLFDDDEFWVNN